MEKTHPDMDFNNPWPINFHVMGNLPSETNFSKAAKRTLETQWIFDEERRYKEAIKNNQTNYSSDFTYSLNKQGWRCDNFEDMDFRMQSIIYLGCSHTFGFSIPEEEIWCSQLHKMIEEEENKQYNLINLGVPGGSVDEWLRLIPYIKKFNPAMIISNTPHVSRMLYIGDECDMPIPLNISMDSKYLRKTIKIYEQLSLHAKDWFTYKHHMTLNVMQSFCETLNINFYESSFPIMTDDLKANVEELKHSQSKFGRDGSHVGFGINNHYARTMLRRITNE
jgi:hypothetical protein